MVEEGVASPEDIDTGHGARLQATRWARCALPTSSGLDVRLGIAEHLAGELGPRFAPPQLLRDMVAARRARPQDRQGFYDYDQ